MCLFHYLLDEVIDTAGTRPASEIQQHDIGLRAWFSLGLRSSSCYVPRREPEEINGRDGEEEEWRLHATRGQPVPALYEQMSHTLAYKH